MNANHRSGIEVYPVGFYHDARIAFVRYRAGRGDAVRYLMRGVRRSGGRRGYWNGFLAEWHYMPEGIRLSKCGQGLTRRAALRRLGAELVRANLLRNERGGAS